MESQIIYCSIFFSSLFFAFLFEKTKDRKFIYIIYLVITVPTVLRFDVGPDYTGYVTVFKTIYNGYKSGVEIGDYFIFEILSNIFISDSKGYVYIIAIYGIFINFFFIRVIYKLDVVLLGLFAFFVFGVYFDSLDRLRQFLAISIFLNLYYELLLKNKLRQYVVSILLLGLLVHKSSYFLLLVPLIIKINISKVLAVIIIISLTLFSFMGFVKGLWSNFFLVISLFYSRYSVDSVYALSGGFSSGLGFIFKILLILFILIYLPKENKKLKNLIFTGGFFYVLASGNLVISRFASYFLSFSIFALPIVLRKVSKTPVKPIVILLCLIYFFKDLGRTHFNYKSIFSDEYYIEEFENRDYYDI